MVCDDYLCTWQAAFFQYRVDCLIINLAEKNGFNFSNILPVFSISSCCVLNKFMNFQCLLYLGGGVNKVPAPCTCKNARGFIGSSRQPCACTNTGEDTRTGHCKDTIPLQLQSGQPWEALVLSPQASIKKKSFEYLYTTDVCLLWIVKLIDTKTFLIALLWSLVAEDKTWREKRRTFQKKPGFDLTYRLWLRNGGPLNLLRQEKNGSSRQRTSHFFTTHIWPQFSRLFFHKQIINAVRQ